MRIQYLAGENLHQSTGIKAKIEAQVDRWRLAGHEVELLHGGMNANIHQRGHKGKYVSNTFLPRHCRSYLELESIYDFFRKHVQEFNPDLIYTRYLFPTLSTSSIFADFRFIVEINSDDIKEYSSKSATVGFFNSLLRSSFLKRASGLIFVSHELASSSAFLKFSSAKTTIGNAANSIAANQILFLQNPKPQVCYVVSGTQSWQGIDKFVLLAGLLPDFDFHLVGLQEDDLVRLSLTASSNVIVHGRLENRHLENILRSSDCAISSLAPHRKGLSEGSPLKSREYASYGIPIVAAYKDTDIPENSEFCLTLPNVENNIVTQVDRIRAFINFAHNNHALRKSFQTFARERLSVEVKEAARLNFFKRVLDEKP